MKRPVVLVATTNPAMALALSLALEKPCLKLGLKLEICPDGKEEKTANVRFYDCAEALFDVLSSRHPMELADTLVILDVGADIKGAFKPKAVEDESWHITANRTGVAVELILRFPQVFPVILSPAVPCGDKSKCNRVEGWKGFFELEDDFTKFKDIKVPEVVNPDNLKAFYFPLHFVSPLDGGDGLRQTIQHFANGMRCWFDPTGLRTLVKNLFLGTVFGDQSDWSNTKDQRAVLLDRLYHVAVAIDEEREFAALNAYTAWKFGRRTWMVTTWAEFDDDPFWVNANEKNDDVLILRDIDLRFSDIPTGMVGLRKDLKSIHSAIWQKCKGKKRLGDTWSIRAISSHELVVTEKEHCFNSLNEEEKRLGERLGECVSYIGHRKPLVSLYQLQEEMVFWKTAKNGQTPSRQSTMAGLCAIQKKGASGGHGAPYLNLSMAESALEQAMRCERGPVENIIGALLASEAYELLLGMSRTTALEALLLMHKKEASAEVSFVGMSNDIDIDPRRDDMETSLKSLAGGNGATDNSNLTHADDLFLSKFWAELKQVYRNGEMFGAAEEANKESLVHSNWIPNWFSFKRITHLYKCKKQKAFKVFIVNVSTFWLYWLLANIIINVVNVSAHLFLKYCTDGNVFKDRKLDCLVELFLSSVLSSITLQPMTLIGKIVDRGGLWEHLIAIFHLGLSYILFGLLISMLYRKITRG